MSLVDERDSVVSGLFGVFRSESGPSRVQQGTSSSGSALGARSRSPGDARPCVDFSQFCYHLIFEFLTFIHAWAFHSLIHLFRMKV